MTCNLCKGIAHEDEGYTIDGELVCFGCYDEELHYRNHDDDDDSHDHYRAMAALAADLPC